jgi:hypothetical protein
MAQAGGAFTLTIALACPPFAEAVTVVVPPASAVTGIATADCPAAKATLSGTLATEASLLEMLNVPAAVGAGESVAVSVPPDPMVRGRGLGSGVVGFGITTVKTVSLMRVPLAPATESESAFLARSVTTRSTRVTPP